MINLFRFQHIILINQNLKVYLEAVSIEFDELYKALYDLRYLRDINSATGIKP
jgi:hypothetical protein